MQGQQLNRRAHRQPNHNPRPKPQNHNTNATPKPDPCTASAMRMRHRPGAMSNLREARQPRDAGPAVKQARSQTAKPQPQTHNTNATPKPDPCTARALRMRHRPGSSDRQPQRSETSKGRDAEQAVRNKQALTDSLNPNPRPKPQTQPRIAPNTANSIPP